MAFARVPVRVWALLATVTIGSTLPSLQHANSGTVGFTCGDLPFAAGTCSNGTQTCDFPSDCGDICTGGNNGTPCGVANFNRCGNVTCSGSECGNFDSLIDQFGGCVQFNPSGCPPFSGICANGTSVCSVRECACTAVDEPCAALDVNACIRGICVNASGLELVCLPDYASLSNASLTCNDNNLCTDESCDPAADFGKGMCVHSAVAGCTDDDGDGVDSSVEDQVPSDPGSPIQPNGDGNGDGILDSLQHNVTSLPSATGKGFLTLVSSCAQNLNVMTFTEGDVGPDPSFEYPFGLIGFKLCNGGINNVPACATDCPEAMVTVIVRGATDVSNYLYRKHGPTMPGDASTTQYYSMTNTTISANTFMLFLRDGQLGDDFGKDGMIVDQGGPGLASRSAAPTLGQWALVAVAVALTAVAAFSFRRRRPSVELS
jgi:hypothetical protein